MSLLEQLDSDTKGPGGIQGFLLQPVWWHEDARCAEPDVDPEWFYVERGQTSSRARAVCAECPVRDECLDFAMNDPDARSWGVGGGTTPRERRQLKDRAVGLVTRGAGPEGPTSLVHATCARLVSPGF